MIVLVFQICIDGSKTKKYFEYFLIVCKENVITLVCNLFILYRFYLSENVWRKRIPYDQRTTRQCAKDRKETSDRESAEGSRTSLKQNAHFVGKRQW